MPRDKSGNTAKREADRQERKAPPKEDPNKSGRERNVGHEKGEEHSRVQKGTRG
jgi:hypothetical protein